MSRRSRSVWAADFETTTETDYRIDGCVRVYLWHARELWSDREAQGTDIESFMAWASEVPSEIWFHNVKYDGNYILWWILKEGWTYSEVQEKGRKTYSHIVTDTGQWMELVLRFGNHVVHIKDSSKKFPGFSLEEVAKEYGIEGKSDLDVHKRRDLSYMPTEEDIERVRGDTRILKTAMEGLLGSGMKALTMASDAKNFYREMWDRAHGPKARQIWRREFPKLPLKVDEFGRRAYKGGYVYVDPDHRGKDLRDVWVYDVNSMFPWAMRHKPLPYGMPVIRLKPKDGELYIVQFEAVFHLKPGKLPTVQLKGSYRYVQAEYVTGSDELVQLSMTNIDYEIFHDHYDVPYEQNHRYFCFRSRTGDYDEYIDHWMAVKEAASRDGDDRTKAVSKRYLNSLYGKRGENILRKGKMSYYDEEDEVVAWDEIETEGEGDYLFHACFITAWARWNIIRTAQVFKDHGDFIYCDTDSVHCTHGDRYTDMIDIHPTRLGAWKLESRSEKGRYIAPKKYIHVNETNDKGKFKKLAVTCAGMPPACKANVTWENFRLGARYDGKLMGKTV